MVDVTKFPFYGWNVTESENFILNQDWECPIPGFFVLGVKGQKFVSISEMSSKEYAEYNEMILKARKLMKALGIETVCFYQEETVSHFHIWIMPRYKWMDKFGKSIDSVKPIMDYAKKNMMTEANVKKVKKFFENAKVEWKKISMK